jgi:hypothetical protein
MENIHQTTSNASNVIAKYLNIQLYWAMCNQIDRSCNICLL